jgi:hypothetical protein
MVEFTRVRTAFFISGSNFLQIFASNAVAAACLMCKKPTFVGNGVCQAEVTILSKGHNQGVSWMTSICKLPIKGTV